MDGQNFDNNGTYNYQDATVYNADGSLADAPKPKAPGFAIAGLIVGIVSILLCCCSGFIGVIPAIVGVVLAIMGNKQQKTGLGTAALIVSIIGVVLNLGMIIFGLVVGVGSIIGEM